MKPPAGGTDDARASAAAAAAAAASPPSTPLSSSPARSNPPPRTTAVWATSSIQRFDSRRPVDLPPGVLPRELCSDRKGMLDQFKPRAMVISTVRVTLTAGSQMLAHYVTDQLESEVKREELVVRGELSPDEADRLNEEWEKREWSSRWSSYPSAALRALGRYHAVTFLMRVTEWQLSRRVSEGTLDRLTRDPFKAAVRASERGLEGRELRREMWNVCLWANAIAFGCECAVSQFLAAWGYVRYSRRRAERRRRIREQLKRQAEDADDIDEEEEDADEGESYVGPTGLSLALRSSRLVASRFLGLLAASAGGALGSQVYPGWGTLFGSSCGDGMAAALLDG